MSLPSKAIPAPGILALFTILLVPFVNTAHAVTPSTHLWSRNYGGSGGSPAVDTGYGVAVDPLRNVIIVGYFDGTASFGGADLTGAGSGDVFVAKYSPNGVHLWSKRFGSTGLDAAQGVAIDAWGNIYVAGAFSGTVDFGNGIGLISAGLFDAFLAKYSPSGATLWSRRMGDVGNDNALSVSVDPTGNPIITGNYTGAASFGGAALTAFGANDIVVAMYATNNGSHTWSRGVGSAGVDVGTSVACDASSNVFVTGYFNNSVNFGGGALVSAGGNDIFLLKYNSAGTHQWSKRFGTVGADAGNGIATDASGNIVITGSFTNTINFGGANLVSAGFPDAFAGKFDTAGNHQWSQRYGDGLSDAGLAVACDASNNVFLTGSFNASINLGGGVLLTVGIGDAYLAKLNSGGVHQWSQRMGGISNDDSRAVACDALGNVAIVGRFELAADFVGATLISNGYLDGFVAKYAGTTSAPDITSIVDIGNDQGRKVKISFTGSGGDNGDAATPINSYEAYRRTDAPPSLTAGAAASSRRQLLDAGWTFAGSVPAHQQPEYSMDAPTIGDSTVALGPYNSTFFIRAASEEVNLYYDSLPDSGYSVDNLAPGIPDNLIYSAGDLDWAESRADDFDYFTVYGSNVDAFGSATLVNYTTSPAMDVSGSPYVFYWVTATDFSGNEGKPARVNTLSGAGGSPKSYVLSVSNYPNPFNPRTTVSYTVPSRGRVMVRVYDAHGAVVATLFNGDRPAGAYTVEWDGRGDGGAIVSSGIYFARIEHSGAVRSKKMVLLK